MNEIRHTYHGQLATCASTWCDSAPSPPTPSPPGPKPSSRPTCRRRPGDRRRRVHRRPDALPRGTVLPDAGPPAAHGLRPAHGGGRVAHDPRDRADRRPDGQRGQDDPPALPGRTPRAHPADRRADGPPGPSAAPDGHRGLRRVGLRPGHGPPGHGRRHGRPPAGAFPDDLRPGPGRRGGPPADGPDRPGRPVLRADGRPRRQHRRTGQLHGDGRDPRSRQRRQRRPRAKAWGSPSTDQLTAVAPA